MKGCLEWLLIHCQFSFQFALYNNWNQREIWGLITKDSFKWQLIPQSRIYSSLHIPLKITGKPQQRSALRPLVFLFSCTFNYLIFTENLKSWFLLEWNIAVLLAHRHLFYTNIPQYDSISVRVIQCTLV